jgi:hypothetical protein
MLSLPIPKRAQTQPALTSLSTERSITPFNINKLVSQSVLSVFVFLTACGTAIADDTEASSLALQNVMRVQYSLTFVSQNIEQTGNVKDVMKDINTLVQNYRLKENIKTSLTIVDKEKYQAAFVAGDFLSSFFFFCIIRLFVY